MVDVTQEDAFLEEIVESGVDLESTVKQAHMVEEDYEVCVPYALFSI